MKQLLLVLVVLAAGCSGSENNTSEVADSLSPQDESIVGLLEEAKRAGADRSQLDALEDSEITYGEYEAGLQRTFECIRDAGIDVVELGIDESRGFPMLDYAVAASAPGLTEDETLAAVSDCMVRFGKFVDMAWQTSSDESVEAEDARWDSFREPLLTCLAVAGKELPSDASRTEIVAGVQEVLDKSGTDCLTEVGFFGG